MADHYTHRHQLQKVAKDADEVELKAITRGSQVFEAGISDDKISGSLQDLEDEADLPPAVPRFQRQDLKADDTTGGIAEEIARRHRIMGGAYPFAVSKTGITYQPSVSKFYEFCLATALSPSITRDGYVCFPRQFERASSLLVEFFMGASAESLHVGAPRDDVVGTTFKKGMETLAQQTGEFNWMPEDGLPAEPVVGGDEGVDFVVWKRMDDRRFGSLFILCQCACGGDWQTKWNDLDLARLAKWFNPMTKVKPVRAFATPFHAVDGILGDGSRRAGLFFDRARLALIAERHFQNPKWIPWVPKLEACAGLVLN